MGIFAVDFTQNELVFIRQCLELPTILGKDAKFLAGLQTKLENELTQIDQIKVKAEQKKEKELQAIISKK